MISKLVANLDVQWETNDALMQAQRMGIIASLIKSTINSVEGLGVRVVDIEIDKGEDKDALEKPLLHP